MTAALEETLRNDSTQHMQAGIVLLERGDWNPALAHFDAAIQLRSQLPWREDYLSAWLLAAAWLNRGDALQRQGNPVLFSEASRSFVLAIDAMHHVPLAEHPAYPERLILAWINRATLAGEMQDTTAALAHFSQAERLLAEWGRDVTPSRHFLCAMLLVNRARMVLEVKQPLSALADARAAIEILRALKAASALIKAWSIECRALSMLLDEPGGAEQVDDWIALATDATEEALALVKATGYLDFWVSDLVRYGARIYRTCQPQFLAEFLSDWVVEGPLAQDAELRREMKNELLLAQMELEQRVLSATQDEEYVQSQIRILKSFQEMLPLLSA